MTTLFAQPYDIAAQGFYFDSFDDYTKKSSSLKNDYGQPVEEFEIQFINGDNIDCDLANAWGIHQGNILAFFDAVDDWDNYQKTIFIIAIGECGYSFDPVSGHPDDFEVDIYELDSMKELAQQFVDDGLYGAIPNSLTYYIDYEAIARDLSVDYSETNIAGKRYIYSCR